MQEKSKQKLTVVGHRGNRLAAPENTIEAFSQCLIDKRVHGIELDTWNNDYGLLPVIHDLELNVTTNGTGTVSKMTAAEISELRCCFKGKPTDANVPDLAHVFKLVQSGSRTDFLVNVEMKAKPEDGDLENAKSDRFAKRIGEVIRSFPMLNIVVSSFDHRRVVNLKQQFPEVQIAFLQEGLTIPKMLSLYTKEYGFSWWNLKHSSVSPMIVKAAKEAEAKVAAWVANDPPEWERLMNCGVDAIITDKPLELADFLER